MHRTQIYLPDALYEGLKIRSRSVGVSISELIRRSLENDMRQDPVADARAFFDRLKPLESFADVHHCPLWTYNRKPYPMDDIELFAMKK